MDSIFARMETTRGFYTRYGSASKHYYASSSDYDEPEFFKDREAFDVKSEDICYMSETEIQCYQTAIDESDFRDVNPHYYGWDYLALYKLVESECFEHLIKKSHVDEILEELFSRLDGESPDANIESLIDEMAEASWYEGN